MTMELIHRGDDRHISLAADYLNIEHPQAEGRLLELITTNLLCFKHLSIGGFPSELMPVITSFPGNIGELQTLTIECYDAGWLQVPISFLEGASSLQELTLIQSYVPSVPLLPFSPSKITVLDLSYTFLEPRDVFTLLSRCLFIKRFQIGVQGLTAGMHSMQKYKSLTLPCLESLALEYNANMHPGSPEFPFLAALIMPRLFFLDANCKWNIDYTLALSHSKCLKSFNIDSSLSAADLDILFPAMPNINHFYFKDAVLSTQTLQGIASGILLSKMEHSGFTCTVPTLDVLGLHLDMLEQRFSRDSGRHNGLLKLRLLWPYNPEDPAPAMRRLHEMRALGWKITLVDTA